MKNIKFLIIIIFLLSTFIVSTKAISSDGLGAPNLLEQTLSAKYGTQKNYDQLVDNGGLNTGLRFYGLHVTNVEGMRYHKEGGIKSVVIFLALGTAPAAIRQALNRSCNTNDSDWKIDTRGEPLTGSATRDGIKCMYRVFQREVSVFIDSDKSTLLPNALPTTAQPINTPTVVNTPPRNRAGSSLLLQSLDVKTGSKDIFSKFQDQGGLNSDNNMYGVYVNAIRGLSYKQNGGIKSAVLFLELGTAPAKIRQALNEVCYVNDSDWIIDSRGEPLTGKANRDGIKCEYRVFQREVSIFIDSIETTQSPNSSSPSSQSQSRPSQTQANNQPKPPTQNSQSNIVWNHNNSKMKIDMVGDTINIYYVQPRQAMLDAGAKPNTLLINGMIKGTQITGTARIFAGNCGQFTYPVTGTITNNGREILLNGQAPVVNRSNCQVTRYVPDPLSFNLIETNSQSNSQPSQAQANNQTKPSVSNNQNIKFQNELFTGRWADTTAECKTQNYGYTVFDKTYGSYNVTKSGVNQRPSTPPLVLIQEKSPSELNIFIGTGEKAISERLFRTVIYLQIYRQSDGSIRQVQKGANFLDNNGQFLTTKVQFTREPNIKTLFKC
jgi:hypothetical protein